MERSSFVFYRSFYEAIKDLPRDVQGEVYTAIMEYGLNGITTERLKPIARSIFTLIKPLIDNNNVKYDNGCKGGRPKTKPKPNENLSETKPKPNEDVNVDDNEDVNDNEKRERGKTAGRFVPPTLQDILDFISENNYSVNGEKFFNHYQEQDWKKKGGESVTDWKARLRVWECDDKHRQGVAPPGKIYSYDQMCDMVYSGKHKNTDFEPVPRSDGRKPDWRLKAK